MSLWFWVDAVTGFVILFEEVFYLRQNSIDSSFSRSKLRLNEWYVAFCCLRQQMDNSSDILKVQKQNTV